MANDESPSVTEIIGKHCAGSRFDDAIYRNINNRTNVQNLRAEIGGQDLDWITLMMLVASPGQRKFELDLTKPLADESEIKETLQKMWRSETEEATIQSLIFALPNIEELAEETHHEVFEWIKAHLEPFKKSVAEWYGGEDKVLGVIKQCESDPSFIQKKKWIYLCCALAVSGGQAQEARVFILTLPEDGSRLTEQVREFALGRLDNKWAASVA